MTEATVTKKIKNPKAPKLFADELIVSGSFSTPNGGPCN